MLKAYLPAFLWLLFITWLSVMPGVQLPSFHFFSMDKLAHAGVYGILTWLLLRGQLRIQKVSVTKSNEILILVLAALYGVLMECVQYLFIPGRFYEYDDMLANAFGVVVGWGFFRLSLKLSKKFTT